MKKYILIIWILFFSINIYSQEDKTVELTTTGIGKSKDIAIQNALRSAIEQAFGVFISSKTELLNDGILNDQIIALSNGNIQKYDIISEVLVDKDYAVTVKSKVSISKLTSFIESKGIEVEFKGAVFAVNIKQQKLNEESELKAIEEMAAILKNISDHSFDFSIDPYSEPSMNQKNNQNWDIPLLIKLKLNSNFENYINYLTKTLKAISMNENEALNYINLKKPIYTIMLRNRNKLLDTIISKNNIEDYLLKLLSNPQNQIQYYNLNEKNNYDFNDSKKYFNSQKLNEMALASNMSYKKFTKFFFYNISNGGFGDNIGVNVISDIPYFDSIVLRNKKSSIIVQDLILYFAHSMQNFIIDDGISKRTYEQLLPVKTDYKTDFEFAIENCCESFYPTILFNGLDYSYSILSGDSNPYTYRCVVNNKNKNPGVYKVEIENGIPIRQGSINKLSVANVNSEEYCTNCMYQSLKPNMKLVSVPFEYFPNLKNELNKNLILNSSFNMVIQFSKLYDNSGVSAIYKFIDRRPIEDINRIKGYKIYSNNSF